MENIVRPCLLKKMFFNYPSVVAHACALEVEAAVSCDHATTLQPR
uniref:Uncharacterized protein n=1 Tax=Hippocampus comes TaxID=109280 RepID=A0A3Q2XU95_HIPCM